MTEFPPKILVGRTLLIHSPSLAPYREASLRLIDTHVAPLTATGVVERVTSDEPDELAPKVGVLVDMDASHVADPAFKAQLKNIHIRQLSNTVKHATAIRRISSAASNAHRFSLVLEDDALFGQTMTTALSSATLLAPSDADIVFLGLPSPSQPPKDTVAIFDDLTAVFGGTLPACESYILTRAAAAKLAPLMSPVRFVTNVQLMYAIKTAGLKAYISVPNVFVDGSKIGVFTCSLDPNSRLIWNQGYCKMDALVRNVAGYAVAGGAESDAAFEQLWEEQQFKEHPDVLALRAMHLSRMARPKDAEAAFQRALDMYDKTGGVINNMSEFLKSYVSLYRDLQ